jgi:hypothetical protein
LLDYLYKDVERVFKGKLVYSVLEKGAREGRRGLAGPAGLDDGGGRLWESGEKEEDRETFITKRSGCARTDGIERTSERVVRRLELTPSYFNEAERQRTTAFWEGFSQPFVSGVPLHHPTPPSPLSLSLSLSLSLAALPLARF